MGNIMTLTFNTLNITQGMKWGKKYRGASESHTYVGHTPFSHKICTLKSNGNTNSNKIYIYTGWDGLCT